MGINSSGASILSSDSVVSGSDKLYRYNLSTPWQANTAVANANIAIAADGLNPVGIQFARNGFYMYVGTQTENTGTSALIRGVVRYRLN